MDPAAFAALLDRCAPGAPVEPLTAIVRRASGFEPLLLTIEGRKPIPVQAMSLEEGVRLATEAAVAGQTVRIGLAQLGPAERKQAGLTISASFDACSHVAALHALYQARQLTPQARSSEKAAPISVASIREKSAHAPLETPASAAQALPATPEPTVERSLAPALAEQRATLDVSRSTRGASLFVYER